MEYSVELCSGNINDVNKGGKLSFLPIFFSLLRFVDIIRVLNINND